VGRWKYGLATLWLAAALSAACSQAVPPAPTAVAVPSTTPSPAPSPTQTAPPTATVSPRPSPTFPPPVYPYISLPGMDRLGRICQAGRQAGMRGGVFTKVGDSITANGMFLVPFGSDGYDLGEYGYLQAAIDFFSQETARESNSFANDSLAARTSWRAEHVLDPAKNRPPCRDGESPLLCEYRIVRPAVAVILLGTNDAMAPTGSYRASMRTIISLTLERGIIPVITTLPVLEGKDTEPYNAFLRDLARDWDVPLIDLSAALAPLPHHGLGPDGIHLSWVDPGVIKPWHLNFGMTVRNLLTLQALDAVWRSYPPG